MGPTTIKRSTVLGGITNLSVLAPVKKGMVIGFEPISYLERLRKVLDALYSARQNVRESELLQPVFPDSVGQFGIIDHFRYALVPPVPGLPLDEAQPDDGTWRLSLNVTFDGGWEPYMRVIYRDLGELLDLLFCNCDDYPGSKTSRYEDYCAWVRRNEVAGGTFYADSVMPLGDHEYLAEVEKAQREGGGDATTDAAIARLALASEPKARKDAQDRALSGGLKTVVSALVLPLRTLTGLYRLSVYFPPGDAANHDGDRGTLRRFAQSVLRGSIDLMTLLDKPSTPGHADWVAAQAKLVPYADQLKWLLGASPATLPAPADPPFDPARIQSHILTNKEPVTHACVVLLRVKDPALARSSLSALAPRCGVLAGTGIAFTVGFTHAGLAALGIAKSRLAGFPQEFAEGMEARSSLLGDVRANHPDRWNRPPAWRHEDSGNRVDMKAVHVLVHLRLRDPKNSSFGLHPLLAAEVDALDAKSGLRVLAVQPTFAVRNAQGEMAGHLNFADGISQPRIDPTMAPAADPPPPFDDRVWPGEVLLGHANNRKDPANPGIDPLRLDGTFVAVRKLRQNMDTLDAAMSLHTQAERDDLLSRMMGRQRDGTPLVPLPPGAGQNDFNYDKASDACPYHSHIRRANPRDRRQYTPRIIRRGMSYGPPVAADPSAERGLVFMAYCASLSEQYETLQRWITGGNSSGVGSAQGDAFLRVPQIGEKYTFRYLDKNGNVARFVLDDKPLVHLEWGLYAFVPSLAALSTLDAWQAELPKACKPADPPPPTAEQLEEAEREQVRQRLDDPDRAPAAWKLVREGAKDAPTCTAYGHLLGTYAEVLDVMKDDGVRYSVQGYGDRMDQSIGLNLLGLDGARHTAQLALNTAVLNIDEKTAYNRTLAVVKGLLADATKFPDLPSPLKDDVVRRPVDTLTLADYVMAALCTHWIGLPEAHGTYMVPGGRVEENPPTPRCPGNFATASRYIFSPQPREGVEKEGRAQGEAVLKAVQDWLRENGAAGLGSLAQEILAGLNKTSTTPVSVTDPIFALNLAGVLLGFPPTVEGNFLRTMETWIKEETLWEFQQALFDATGGAEPSYDQANAALRKPLLATMRKRPVPEMLWRCSVDAKGVVDKQPKNHVVLGLTSALTDPAAPDALMFGRNQPDEAGGSPCAPNETVHGCPGYYMAMGVMLAMFAGLLNAGSLRPTGSPVLLILTPKPTPTPTPPPAGLPPTTALVAELVSLAASAPAMGTTSAAADETPTDC
ncbi:Dyp-type peroxidase domain-containing protein [Variovorax sp. dw_954]|uniref:Dyp-type peroxidase n=1 Tax=Variovorax sp. dw_954 TaxID=2720078 RepID=UPI001BD3C336|nr:Dyp-type peroxidase domain-containing protein [Variovorax sp. dw_954]